MVSRAFFFNDPPMSHWSSGGLVLVQLCVSFWMSHQRFSVDSPHEDPHRGEALAVWRRPHPRCRGAVAHRTPVMES